MSERPAGAILNQGPPICGPNPNLQLIGLNGPSVHSAPAFSDSLLMPSTQHALDLAGARAAQGPLHAANFLANGGGVTAAFHTSLSSAASMQFQNQAVNLLMPKVDDTGEADPIYLNIEYPEDRVASGITEPAPGAALANSMAMLGLPAMTDLVGQPTAFDSHATFGPAGLSMAYHPVPHGPLTPISPLNGFMPSTLSYPPIRQMTMADYSQGMAPTYLAPATFAHEGSVVPSTYSPFQTHAMSAVVASAPSTESDSSFGTVALESPDLVNSDHSDAESDIDDKDSVPSTTDAGAYAETVQTGSPLTAAPLPKQAQFAFHTFSAAMTSAPHALTTTQAHAAPSAQASSPAMPLVTTERFGTTAAQPSHSPSHLPSGLSTSLVPGTLAVTPLTPTLFDPSMSVYPGFMFPASHVPTAMPTSLQMNTTLLSPTTTSPGAVKRKPDNQLAPSFPKRCSGHKVKPVDTMVVCDGLKSVKPLKQFPCSYSNCTKTFSKSSSAKSHEMTHTNNRPFECPSCLRPFGRNHDLQRHLNTHKDIKPYECEKCLVRFTRNDALRRHRRNNPKCDTTGMRRMAAYKVEKPE
ncbi:hypothetical protein H4R34_003991 [Dimargaris verticillata]|uniref:C2H2-type domain-containing protein n=1 Tax=Dimargaris verticillata TaxID=2761393 RepID=A0A9W8B1C0_9FUNG|nr:hypothetical protein H4R34_003991 [Dimargaris verticillata]